MTEYAFGTKCDMVLSLPMKLGLVKTDEEFYGENLAKKGELRKEQFANYNLREEGKMSFDWPTAWSTSSRNCCSMINKLYFSSPMCLPYM